MFDAMKRTSTINILLVEDIRGHAELVRRSLEKHEDNVVLHHVFDGEEALRFLQHQDEYVDEELSPKPQLILLDIRLPKMSGIEVLKIIRESEDLTMIPVVILTSSESQEDIEQAYAHYANSYLVKPVDFDEFSDMMSKLVDYWTQWNYAYIDKY